MFDYTDDHGFLVQKYGPHTFHTANKALYDYMCRFENWQEYKLTCGAVWDGKYTPTPFNFTTIDTFYSAENAEQMKTKLNQAFGDRKTATVVEVLAHEDEDIRAYAEYLFANDYAPYTAKQWGVSSSEIDPSVLKRVPLRFEWKYTEEDSVQNAPVVAYPQEEGYTRITEYKNYRCCLVKAAVMHSSILWPMHLIRAPSRIIQS